MLAAVLPILNPAATAPIFLGLTEGASAATRALPARRIALAEAFTPEQASRQAF